MNAYEIKFRNTPGGEVRTVTQFHADANMAAAEGMESIRQYEPEAEFLSAWEVRDPRGRAVEAEAPARGFYALNPETGEWEQI